MARTVTTHAPPQTATLTLQQLKRPYDGGNNNHASLAPLEARNDNL